MTTSAPLLGEPVAVELMNTIWADREGVHDALATGRQARAWLSAVAPRLDAVRSESSIARRSSAEATAVELRLLRDALRRLAADAVQDPRPAAASPTRHLKDAVEHLNRAAARAPRWTSLRRGRPGGPESRRIVHTGVTVEAALIAQIAECGIDVFTAADRPALRACLAPGCVQYYVQDHPRRAWCSPACGNRARVARHYRRHHEGR